MFKVDWELAVKNTKQQSDQYKDAGIVTSLAIQQRLLAEEAARQKFEATSKPHLRDSLRDTLIAARDRVFNRKPYDPMFDEPGELDSIYPES